jgi:hypothetical protein
LLIEKDRIRSSIKLSSQFSQDQRQFSLFVQKEHQLLDELYEIKINIHQLIDERKQLKDVQIMTI